MIDNLITDNKSFVLYRLPQNEQIHLLVQEKGELELFYNIESLNGKKGYVIAPFQISEKHPIILINPDREEILSIPKEDLIFSYLSSGQEHTEPTEDYRKRFDSFITALRDNRFNKLVLSRDKKMKKEAGFSAESAFYAACRKYIYSYVYMFYTPRTGLWLGCTPEILLSGRGRVWNTVALAGTQLQKNGKLPDAWDEKNKIEQRWVATYIKDQLHTYGICSSEEGPYTVPAGKVAHLKSDFYFHLEDKNHLGDLLKLLHPTPAVCGLPKEGAKEFILKEEGYDRSYYSGFLGWLDSKADTNTDLYVNLRCMQIGEEDFTLYAGGGILPSSTLQDEWIETEDKLQTMLVLTKANVLG